MKWFRNWFARSQSNGAPRARRSFRPELDVLEDRRLCNVSSVFNKFGGLQTFIVDKNGVLMRNSAVLNVRPSLPVGVTVRNAHGFLDKKGKVSVDVVYSDGQAWRSDSSGQNFVADHVLNMNTIVTATGVVKTFFVFAPGASFFNPDTTGNFVVRAKGVDTMLDTNVRWASAFLDVNGKVGTVAGKKVASGNLVVTRTIGIASTTLYNAPDGATQDITHYSQTSFGGQTVIDLTWGRIAGTYALRFRQFKVTLIGDGTSIAVGG